MGRLVRIGIVVVWLGLVGVLVSKRWERPPAPPIATAPQALRTGEEWLNVFQQDRKIGYVHQRSIKREGTFEFEQQSLLRLVVMDTPQTVRTVTSGRAGANYALQDFTFELSSGVGNLRVRGEVTEGALTLALATGAEESSQRIPLTGPIYLPATLRSFVAAGELHAGRQFQVEVFDPSAMKNAPMLVAVERREVVPQGPPEQQAWRIREEFRGIRTTAWIDDDGNVIREEGPMGLTTVRTDATEAIHGGWSSMTPLDLVETVAVPVARPIANPRDLSVLRLRLRGVDLDQVPSDGRQRRDGDIWLITREDLGEAQSFLLPYAGTDHGADLGATPLLQVDHPRVRAVAAEAVGDERDALRAVHRLLAWIGGAITQTPTVSIPNALQVLDERVGDCNEHAVLFAALARAVGLPTRVVAGAVYQEGAFYYHAWNEVWLGHWVSIDPTFGQFPADATHLKFVDGGPEEHLAMLQVVGRLGIEVLAEQ